MLIEPLDKYATIKEIQEWLDEHGVEYKKRLRKNEYIKLMNKHAEEHNKKEMVENSEFRIPESDYKFIFLDKPDEDEVEYNEYYEKSSDYDLKSKLKQVKMDVILQERYEHHLKSMKDAQNKNTEPSETPETPEDSEIEEEGLNNMATKQNEDLLSRLDQLISSSDNYNDTRLLTEAMSGDVLDSKINDDTGDEFTEPSKSDVIVASYDEEDEQEELETPKEKGRVDVSPSDDEEETSPSDKKDRENLNMSVSEDDDTGITFSEVDEEFEDLGDYSYNAEGDDSDSSQEAADNVPELENVKESKDETDEELSENDVDSEENDIKGFFTNLIDDFKNTPDSIKGMSLVMFFVMLVSILLHFVI